MYHGPGAGEAAEARFDQVFKRHEAPQDVPEVPLPPDIVRDGRVWLVRALAASGLVPSNAEARRAIAQGAVRIDGEQITDPELEVPLEELVGSVLQVGRRRFARITAVV
jgi:tyrosyl-tRNA synthetase